MIKGPSLSSCWPVESIETWRHGDLEKTGRVLFTEGPPLRSSASSDLFTEAPGKHARETPRRATPKEGCWGCCSGAWFLRIVGFFILCVTLEDKDICVHLKTDWGQLVFDQRLKWEEVRVFWQILDEIRSPKLCTDWGVLETVTAPASSFSAVSHTLFKISDIPNYLHLSGPPASPCSFCPISLEPENPHSASYLAWGPMCAPILIALLPPNPNLLAVSRQQIIPLAHQELTAEWAT